MDKNTQRKQQIEAAAYELLVEKGYKSTSMLAIAKRASASNETLYKWYGTKQALFQAIVESTAQEVRSTLKKMNDHPTPLRDFLQEFGSQLLKLVTGEKAVNLNRAAVVDTYESNTLGIAIAQGGKDGVFPLIKQVLERAKHNSELTFDSVDEVAAFYIHNLIGDLQIQRVIGALPELSDEFIQTRSSSARDLLLITYGSD